MVERASDKKESYENCEMNEFPKSRFHYKLKHTHCCEIPNQSLLQWATVFSRRLIENEKLDYYSGFSSVLF